MEGFLLVYRVVLTALAAGAAIMLVACVWLLVVAYRRGRLAQALAGGFSAFRGSRTGSATSAAGAGFHHNRVGSSDGHDVNPSTGLPMDSGGSFDVYGNALGAARDDD